MYPYTYVYTYTPICHPYTYVYTYMYAHIYIYTHTCIHILQKKRVFLAALATKIWKHDLCSAFKIVIGDFFGR